MVASLSFVSKFNVDVGEKQDYFSFNGNDNAAHLSRSNGTVNLILMSGNNYELYQTFNVSNSFTFKWDGYMVNSRKMNLIKSSGKVNQTQYDSYSFFSTELEFEKEQLEKDELEFCSCDQTVFGCRDINYGLIALIMFGVGVGLRSDDMVKRIWNQLTNGYKLADINELTTIEEDEI